MKRLSILLLITLLAKTLCFSQTTSTDSLKISHEQLKGINLIFAEHSKLKSENTLLWNEIKLFKEKDALHAEVDSLNKLEITAYQNKVQVLNDNVTNLNKKLKRQKVYTGIWRVGGISVSIGLLVWALLK